MRALKKRIMTGHLEYDLTMESMQCHSLSPSSVRHCHSSRCATFALSMFIFRNLAPEMQTYKNVYKNAHFSTVCNGEKQTGNNLNAIGQGWLNKFGYNWIMPLNLRKFERDLYRLAPKFL